MSDVAVYKGVSDFRMDFNILSNHIDAFPDNTFITKLRIKIKPINTIQIDELRSHIKNTLNYDLLDCDIYGSLSSFYAGTNQHIDPESVFILNCYGKVCYNIFREKIESYVLEEGDGILIPNGITHSAIPLTPRISLSFRVE